MIANLTGSTQQIATTQQVRASQPVSVRYEGFSLRESTGTGTALVRIFDGMDATGTVLDEVALGPGESAREHYRGGFTAAKGIFIQVVSGSVAGSVRYS